MCQALCKHLTWIVSSGFQVLKNRISYLTKCHQAWQLKAAHSHLPSHSFRVLGIWAWLSWVLGFKVPQSLCCLGYSPLKDQLGKDLIPNSRGHCQDTVPHWFLKGLRSSWLLARSCPQFFVLWPLQHGNFLPQGCKLWGSEIMLARQMSQSFVPIHGSDTHHLCHILLVRIEPPCPVHTQKDMDPWGSS